jgi:hypothetical protein
MNDVHLMAGHDTFDDSFEERDVTHESVVIDVHFCRKVTIL